MQRRLPPVHKTIRLGSDREGRNFMGETIRFHLNLQMMADEMQPQFPECVFVPGDDACCLRGTCFYKKGIQFEKQYVYIVKEENLRQETVPQVHCSLIILGEIPQKWRAGSHSLLGLPSETDLLELMNLCQTIFRKHLSWAESLQDIFAMDGSVDDLCKASIGYFQNPLFVHDSQMTVISCPVWRDKMIHWEKDERTGSMIMPLEELNELKTDREYLETMVTRNARIFSAELRGYRDIYVNIWNAYGRYEGRLVICEIDSVLKKGQFAAAEYLAELVKLTLARRSKKDNTYSRILERMIISMLQGNEVSDAEIDSRIGQCGWKREDTYICIRMDAEEQEGNPGSAASVCNYVEARVAGSKAVFMEDHICIIINLSVNHHYTSDMACILRDGLFKAGVSNTFRDFGALERYYRQASVAFAYCKKKNDMMWYYTFDDIAVDYLSDLCCREFCPEDICACELLQLKAYDEKNKTELYKTLVTYILNERNTVATSAELYVGRSTLFYRLKKIQQITGLDADHMAQPEQNLYLRLSIYIMEKNIMNM